MTEQQVAALRQGMREDVLHAWEDAPELDEATIFRVAEWIGHARTDAALLELWDRRVIAIGFVDGEITFSRRAEGEA